MKLQLDLFRCSCSRSRWGRRSAAPGGRSYREEASVTLTGHSQCGETRRGVALIVVLGFLSIMLMMAIAFLTHARIERQVSDFSMEAQRGRQLLRTGLNAAMNDYSSYLANQNLVMPITDEARLFTSVAPSSAFGISGAGRTLGGSNIELLVGEVEDWIPRRYMRHLVPNAQRTADMLDGPNIVEDAEWILVRENPKDTTSRILGRYAYACFDMSGAVDANLIARENEIAGHDARAAQNRERRSVRQVPMRMLPETADGGEFKRLRRGWKGFDSLQMLIHLTDGRANSGVEPPTASRWDPERKEIYGAGLYSNLVTDLTSYSLAGFRGARYNRASGLWTPYTLVDIDTPWPTVLQPLAGQFEGGIPGWLDDALFDYTSTSKTPKGTDYPSPKNVPMFNEIIGKLQFKENPDGTNPGSSKYYLDVKLDFEFWYPFPSVDNDTTGTFELLPPSIGGGYATSGDANIWMRMALMAPGAVYVELAPPDTPPPALSVAAEYHGGLPYVPTDSPFTYRMEIRRPAGDTNPIPSNARLMIQGAIVKKPITLTAGGTDAADTLPVDITLSGAMNLNPDGEASFARAVVDPRLNHKPGQWVEENGGEGTKGEMNEALQPGGGSYADFIAEGTNLYCRNNPMETPAELGFISTGKAWETIDLFTDKAVALLATLVTDTNLYNTGRGSSLSWDTSSVFYTNGTINPNTRSSNVLASAFIDLPRHEVPNVESTRVAANPLNEDTADGRDIVDALVQAILDETKSGKIDDCFQAGTDWARIDAMKQKRTLAKLGMNNNQREELLRRTWGLFSPNNSMFTVVAVAQTIKEGPTRVGIWDDEDLITGERRAVALVWRDPYKTGRNLHHEMFVRVFRYLND